MIKSDIAAFIYERHGGMTRAEAEALTDDLLTLLKQSTAGPEPLTITRFGKFRQKPRSVREVVMPDGRKRLTSSVSRLQFLPSPALKTALNSGEEEP